MFRVLVSAQYIKSEPEIDAGAGAGGSNLILITSHGIVLGPVPPRSKSPRSST